MRAKTTITKLATGGATLLAAFVLSSCEQWDIGSVGRSGDISIANVDPENLCDWNHYTNYDEPRAHMAVSCKSSRQVYTTCDIWLWPRVGSPERERTHGAQRCSARVYPYGTPNWGLGAMGSIGTIWLRLDNPRRRWEFGNWGKADCSVTRNAENQSILECGHVHGSPNFPARAARLGETAARPLSQLAARLTPATRARVFAACGDLPPGAIRQLDPNRACARAGRRALSELPRSQRGEALRQLRASGVSLNGR